MPSETERILTTHVGSLPRSQAVAELLRARETAAPYAAGEFERVMRAAVADVVQQQARTGIDIVSDGETAKISYATYVHERLSGFDGAAASGLHPSAELRRQFRAGHELGVSGGAYLYTPRELSARRNHWLRADLRLALPARGWLGLSIEADGGDDQRGRHLGAELGRRF